MSVSAESVLKVARGYIGVKELTGHNDGAAVHHIQSTTGAYGAAWCVSFVQTVLKESGAGIYADDTAGVFYLRDFARRHGDVVASPAPGRLVLFNEGEGHIGIVESVNGDGSFNTIEGNHENQCMRVRRAAGANHPVFVQVPTVTLLPSLITPTFPEWADWRLGEGKFSGHGSASASARPKNWKPAVPASYFHKLGQEMRRRKKPVPKPIRQDPRFLPKNGVLPGWYHDWAVWKINGQRAHRPKAPRLIPPWAWRRLTRDTKLVK